VFPRERRGMGEQFGRDSVMFAAQVIDGIGQVRGIPVDDSRDDQVEAGSPELLRVRTAVSDAPLLERADSPGRGRGAARPCSGRRGRAAGVAVTPASMNRVRSIRPSS
jgi:hypothetical protein